METGFVSAFWFLFISALTVPLLLGIGWLMRPKKKGSELKATAYECGEEPVGSAWAKFNIRYYVIAIIFIIFDVEVATVFPTITIYKSAVQEGAAGLAFIKIFLFVALLLSGLLYCWVRGDFTWIKSIRQSGIRK